MTEPKKGALEEKRPGGRGRAAKSQKITGVFVKKGYRDERRSLTTPHIIRYIFFLSL